MKVFPRRCGTTLTLQSRALSRATGAIMDTVLYVIGGLAAGAVTIYRVRVARSESRRKEAHDAVTQMIAKAQQIDQLAIDYQMKAGSDPECVVLGAEIRRSLKQLGIMVTNLHHLFQDKSLLSALMRFRQKVSCNLDQRLRSAIGRDHQQIVDIENAYISLCNYALSIFHSRFK